MRISYLNEDCVGYILNFLPVVDVWKYGEAIPNAAAAVRTYWRRKRVIIAKNIHVADADIFLSIIEKCVNLETLNVTNELCKIKQFENLPSIVGKHCRKIKHLFLPGLIFDEIIIDHLSHLSSLETLFITVTDRMRAYSKDNVNGSCLVRLPKTIQNLELQVNISGANLPILMDNLLLFPIEHLNLFGIIVHEENVITLSRLTSLRSINLHTCARDYVLRDLFKNNPNLASITLHGTRAPDLSYDAYQELGISFTFLSNVIKKIHISGTYSVDYDIFLECLRNWQLEYLYVPYSLDRSSPFLGNFGELTPDLQELHFGFSKGKDAILRSIKKMTKLKHLCLMYLHRSNVKLTISILKSFARLEVLSLLHVRPCLKLFEVIGLLPSLDTLHLMDIYHANFRFDDCIKKISRSQSLTSIKIEESLKFDNNDALQLIEGCRQLKRLEIIQCSSITIDLIKKVVELLKKQKDRRSILNLIINKDNILQKDVPNIKFHRLLEVEIVQRDVPRPM